MENKICETKSWIRRLFFWKTIYRSKHFCFAFILEKGFLKKTVMKVVQAVASQLYPFQSQGCQWRRYGFSSSLSSRNKHLFFSFWVQKVPDVRQLCFWKSGNFFIHLEISTRKWSPGGFLKFRLKKTNHLIITTENENLQVSRVQRRPVEAKLWCPFVRERLYSTSI